MTPAQLPEARAPRRAPPKMPRAANRTIVRVRCPWCLGRYEDAADALERNGACPHCGVPQPIGAEP